jgi:hypothetical protein
VSISPFENQTTAYQLLNNNNNNNTLGERENVSIILKHMLPTEDTLL